MKGDGFGTASSFLSLNFTVLPQKVRVQELHKPIQLALVMHGHGSRPLLLGDEESFEGCSDGFRLLATWAGVSRSNVRGRVAFSFVSSSPTQVENWEAASLVARRFCSISNTSERVQRSHPVLPRFVGCALRCHWL